MSNSINLGIKYETNSEYQDFINTIIYERKTEKPLIYKWNEKVASQHLDFVYIKTRKIKIFNKLYVLAASLIMSENPEIGVAILCSYTYLFSFYQCLVFFFKQSVLDETILENHSSFIDLIKMLTTI